MDKIIEEIEKQIGMIKKYRAWHEGLKLLVEEMPTACYYSSRVITYNEYWTNYPTAENLYGLRS